MRILHTADWHLGRSLEQNSRLAEQAAFLDELGGICRDQAVDLLLVTGDVFDTYNPPAAAETLLFDALERLADQGRRAIIVIAGNHDNPDRLSAAAPLAYRHGIYLLGYPASDAGEYQSRHDGPDILEAAGPGWLRLRPAFADCAATILTLPYPSEARLSEMTELLEGETVVQQAYSARIAGLLGGLADAHFSPDTVNLIATHLFVQGGWGSDSERTLQLGAAMLVDPAGLPAAAQYIALGHLHRPQTIQGSPAPAVYAGSPLAYSFSEAGTAKSVTLIEAQPGQPAQISLLPLQSGRPLRRWQAREGLAQAMTWAEEGRDADCWIDVEITSDRLLTATETKALRELNPGILYIRTLLTGSAAAVEAAANRAGRRIEDLFTEFYLLRHGVEIPAAVLADFIRLAAAEAEVEP